MVIASSAKHSRSAATGAALESAGGAAHHDDRECRENEPADEERFDPGTGLLPVNEASGQETQQRGVDQEASEGENCCLDQRKACIGAG